MTTLVVAAAVVRRGDTVLVARRQPGVHLAGLWEFPGGKCEPGESCAACLVRELREELAVVARPGAEIYRTAHDYPDRRVELHFLACEVAGEPAAQLGQEVRWVPRADLGSLEFPPADAELIAMLTRG
ncbi:MAG TPA: 8-oxo-dGTP diphosphatase MutT [Vicinamibacterales bacterium]|nr:8-oxo-dGTP diphosphatase MutT [Vicinamibacterales bacterium]